MLPNRQQRDTFIAYWKEFQPPHAPEGWATNMISPFEETSGIYLWADYVATVESEAWFFENGMHILGTPIPLLHREEECITVFTVGGLLCVRDQEMCCYYVMQPHVTVDDIVNWVNAGHVVSELPVLQLTGDATVDYESQRFTVMWEWEWAEHGRNRWQELKDRGGEVDACWTGERPEPGGPWMYGLQ